MFWDSAKMSSLLFDFSFSYMSEAWIEKDGVFLNSSISLIAFLSS